MFKSKKYLNILVLFAALFAFIIFSPYAYLSIFKDQLDANPNIVTFSYLRSSYFYVLIITTLIIYFRFKKAEFLKRSEYYLWLYSIFYLLYKIPYGFDVTDQGYHLSKAWAVFSPNPVSQTDMMWLSTVISGLWLKIPGNNYVIWTRIGYSLVVSLIIYFCVKTAYLFCKKNIKHFLLFALASIFTIHYNYYLTINYDNLPVLFLMVSIYILFTSIENKKNDNKRSLVLSGFLIGLAFFSKNTIILAVILPLCIIAESGLDSRAKAMKLKYIYAGFSFCLFFGLIAMALLSEMNNYANVIDNVVFNNRIAASSDGGSVFEIFLNDSMKAEAPRKLSEYYFESGDSQTASGLFNLYIEEFWSISGIASLTFAVILFTLLICGLTSLNLMKVSAILIVSAALFYNNYADIHDFPKCRQVFSDFILALISVILTINFLRKNYDDTRLNLIALTGFILMLTAFVGSNIGVVTSFRSGGSLLLLLSCIIINENSSDNGFFRIDIASYKISGFNIIIAFIIILSVWNVNFLSTHRDFPKSSLTSMFKSDVLFGVFSTPQRVKTLDELVKFSENFTFQNNSAVVIGNMPMLHFLLEKDMLTRTPWIELSNFRYFCNKMEQMEYENLPSMVIFCKKSGRSLYWPVADIHDKYSKYDLKWRDYFRYFVKKNSYKAVFENDTFLVYEKQQGFL